MALDVLDFRLIRYIAPGEAVFIETNGKLHTKQCAEKTFHSPCIFEYVYFARPDSIIDNISVYKAFTHQHLAEIRESLQQLQPNLKPVMPFIPYRGNFTRGILITAYKEFKGSLAEAQRLFAKFYAKEPFVFVSATNIDVKQVANTNKCLVYLEKHGNKLMIIAAIDKKLTDQLNLILHHDDFQKLEGSWRGLHYLVNNTETDEMLKIRVLNGTKKEVRRDLESAIEFDQSNLFKMLFKQLPGRRAKSSPAKLPA